MIHSGINGLSARHASAAQAPLCSRSSVPPLSSARNVLAAFFLLSIWLLAGCAPRGETNTLEEILNDAKKNYARELRRTPDETRLILSSVQPLLERFEQAARNSVDSPHVRIEAESFAEMAQELSSLSSRAGMPSRAAFGALMAQYQGFSEATAQAEAPAPNALKLLVARTYNLLGSELQSTAFALNS